MSDKNKENIIQRKVERIKDICIKEYNKSSLEESNIVPRGAYEKILRDILAVINEH